MKRGGKGEGDESRGDTRDRFLERIPQTVVSDRSINVGLSMEISPRSPVVCGPWCGD